MRALVLDHLIVYGDVDRVARELAAAVGAEPVDGGVHPGAGTRNAMFAARGGCAFEVLGADAEQEVEPEWAPAGTTAHGVLWWWAVRTEQPLDDLRRRLEADGVATSEPEPGSRTRPGGDRVAWETVDIVDHPYGTALPFAIRWTEGTPPWAIDVAPVCRIDGFRLGHPDADGLGEVLSRLGLDVPVEVAAEPTLSAALVGPAGVARFTSR